MAIDPTIAEIACDVVRRYFAAINAGDTEGVRDAFNFPHVRIGAKGNVTYYPDRHGDHLDNFRQRMLGEEWHRSVLDAMEVIYTLPTKAHVSILFWRLRVDDSEIGSYHSLYIITEIDGHWGLQGGSGNGS